MFIVQLRILRRSSKTHEDSLIYQSMIDSLALSSFIGDLLCSIFRVFQGNHSMERHGSLLDQLNARRLKIIERST